MIGLTPTTEGTGIGSASIQADIVREPFLKIFIDYPKHLDDDLDLICQDITLPDSVKGFKRRTTLDSAHIICLNQFFQISVNDSVYQNVEFLYEKIDGAGVKGLVTYLPTQQFKTGRNTLKIKNTEADSLPKQHTGTYATIPFWFAPE